MSVTLDILSAYHYVIVFSLPIIVYAISMFFVLIRFSVRLSFLHHNVCVYHSSGLGMGCAIRSKQSQTLHVC